MTFRMVRLLSQELTFLRIRRSETSILRYPASLGVNRRPNARYEFVLRIGRAQKVPARKCRNDALAWKDDQILPAEASCHPHQLIRILQRQQPPLESVLVVFFRCDVRTDRLLHPQGRNQ